MRIDRIRQAYNVDIQFVQFPLHPETPLEGKPLEALFNTGPDEIAQKNAHMKGLMEAEGLPYGRRTHTYNSRKAQELAKWAETQDNGQSIHDALFRAYFVDTQNVADKGVLLSVCKNLGLDVDAAASAIDGDTYKDAVDADWKKSREYGVTGVPTYVAGQAGIVGAQPYEAIEQLLQQSGVTQRGG